MLSSQEKQALELDLAVGDILLGGRFRNQRIEVEELGTDDLGQPTVNGRKLLNYRIEKLLPPDKRGKGKQEIDKQAFIEGYTADKTAETLPTSLLLGVPGAVARAALAPVTAPLAMRDYDYKDPELIRRLLERGHVGQGVEQGFSDGKFVTYVYNTPKHLLEKIVDVEPNLGEQLWADMPELPKDVKARVGDVLTTLGIGHALNRLALTGKPRHFLKGLEGARPGFAERWLLPTRAEEKALGYALRQQRPDQAAMLTQSLRRYYDERLKTASAEVLGVGGAVSGAGLAASLAASLILRKLRQRAVKQYTAASDAYDARVEAEAKSPIYRARAQTLVPEPLKDKIKMVLNHSQLEDVLRAHPYAEALAQSIREKVDWTNREGMIFRTGSDVPDILVYNPLHPADIIRHEVGHAQQLPAVRRRWRDRLRGVFSPRYTNTYLKEQDAWNRAGIPEDNPLRGLALKTYETGEHIQRLNYAQNAAATAAALSVVPALVAARVAVQRALRA